MGKKAFEILSERAGAGLSFIYDMRMVNIVQFANAAGFSHKYATDFLYRHYRRKHLGLLGGTPLGGRGRAPNVYYLTEKGHEYFSDIQGLPLGPYITVKPRSLWPRNLPHRLQLVDLYQALEAALKHTGQGRITASRFDFRQSEYMGAVRCETTDFLSSHCDEKHKIIPDAAMTIERADGAKALIFIECDMGSEAILQTKGQGESIEGKFHNYTQYFQSNNFASRYKSWGRFSSFIMLLVTTSQKRVDNIREALGAMPSLFDPLFLLSTHDAVQQDACGAIWMRINNTDMGRYALLDI